MEKILNGIGASPNLSIGETIWWKHTKPVITEQQVDSVETEISRFETAIEDAKKQITELKHLTEQKMGPEEAAIFDAHLTFLDDPAYVEEIKNRIQTEKKNALWTCEQVTNEMHTMLSSIEDEYIRARADDIRDVGNRLLLILAGETPFDPATLRAGQVVVAEELTPSETAQFPTGLAGMITAKGSKTAHAAIMARTLGIPAVLGLGEDIKKIANKQTVIVDGDRGEVILNPTDQRIKQVTEWIAQQQKRQNEALQAAKKDAVTKDGKRIQTFANIGSPSDIQIALNNHAEGVGLFRTEFLYLENTDWPTEEEQYTAYAEVLSAFGHKPVVIRTLDIGGDKDLPYAKLPKEENPFLGHRALRFCLDQPEIFKTQLKALLRASVHGNLWIMLPMVENPSEIRAAKELLDQCRQELAAENIPFADHIPLGIMIEIPAAAINADILAPEVDFMSIGTNDLAQYTLAADRGNEKVAHLYDAAHPAVLRLVKMTTDAAKKAGILVGMCGELAGDLALTEVLIGLGLDELSMSAATIPEAKQKIRQTETQSAASLAEQVLQQVDGEQVRKYLNSVGPNNL